MSTFWSKRRTTSSDRQIKKHYTQMTLEEKKQCILVLKQRLNCGYKFTFSRHFKEKSKTHINMRTLLGFIHNNNFAYLNVIEYNHTYRGNTVERRLILKSPSIVRVEGCPCYQYLVIRLDTLKVITTYYNKITDTHKTLDIKYYTQELKIS